MKNIIITLFLLSISMIAYSQDKWIDVAVTENEEIYVDSTNIEIRDGVIYATIKTVYTTSESRQNYINNIKKAFTKKADKKIKKWDNFRYNISYRIYDCSNKQFKTIRVEDYRSDGSNIIKTKTDKQKARWIPVEIDSVADHVLFYLCDYESR